MGRDVDVLGNAVPISRRPAGLVEERPRAARVELRQRWDHLTFLHWRYDAAEVRKLVPPELEVEQIDGSAWVGLALFRAERTRLFGIPMAPAYPETNLRTYVRTPDGLDAVWFLSLEASSLLVVAAARGALGVPYHWAAMQAETSATRCRYLSRRRLAPAVSHDVEVIPGPALEGNERTDRHERLTARWRLVVPGTRGQIAVPVRHGPWPLHAAEVVRADETLIAAAGLPPPDTAPEGWWSPGVDAAILLPRRTRRS